MLLEIPLADFISGNRLVVGVLLCPSLRVYRSLLDVLRLLAASGSSAACGATHSAAAN